MAIATSTALLIAAGTAAGASVYSANAAKKAGQKQVDAAKEGQQLLQDNYENTEKRLDPYIQAGVPALNRQQALLGLQGVDKQKAAFGQFQTSPAFEFNRSNVMRDVNQQASSTGQLRSGNRLAALTDRLSGLYSQEYNNYFNQLGSQTGVGLGAASALGGVGQNAAAGQASLAQGAGNAQANATLGRAAAFQSGIADLAGLYFNRQALSGG